MCARSPKIPQGIQRFDDDLALQLEHLKPAEGDGSKLLQVPWLSRLLTLAIDKHVEAVHFIPPLHFPLLVSDEKLMNEFMDHTRRMLDACNALTRSLSNIEHGHLLIRHACHILSNAENVSPKQEVRPPDAHKLEERLYRAHKSLREWLDLQVSSISPSPKYVAVLQGMVKDLGPPCNRALGKCKGFLYALYGAKAVGVLACYVLSLALSRDRELVSLTLSIPPWVSWSASISHLVQVAKEEAMNQTNRSVGLEDLGPLEASVRGLLGMTEHTLGLKEGPLPERAEEMLIGAVNNLCLQMDEVANVLKVLGTKLNEMFRTIVLNRSALLGKMGDFASDDE